MARAIGIDLGTTYSVSDIVFLCDVFIHTNVLLLVCWYFSTR